VCVVIDVLVVMVQVADGPGASGDGRNLKNTLNRRVK
jgi:hypothetical protein